MRVVARIGLEAERSDRLEVRTEVGVAIEAGDTERRSSYSYSPGPGIADVRPDAGDLSEAFDFFARDQVGDAVRDMRAHGYDGPDPLDVEPLSWEIDPAVLAAQARLDARPPG